MTIQGTDLRDAFDPLAGDPVKDAAMVLRGMPKPGVPPVAWWLLAAGLLVGLASGPWLFGGDEPADNLPIVQQDKNKNPEGKDEVPPPKKTDEKKEDEKRKIDISPPDEKDLIWFYGIGDVTVTEPNAAEETLKGDHQLPIGSKFDTGSSIAGMLLAYENQLRLDRATVVTVKLPHNFELTEGRVWIYGGEPPGPMIVVKTPGGFVDIIGGMATVDFRDGTIQAVCLSGEAIVRPNGESAIELEAGTMGWIGEGKRGGPSKIGFEERYTSWMTKLLLQQQDRSEVEKRIQKMVEAYFGRQYRLEAKAEIRKLGPACIPKMAKRLIETTGLRPTFVQETARMIGNMAEPTTMEFVFWLLRHPDGEVRVLAYESIYRMTGENAGTGDKYWREDRPAEEREKVILEWWGLVK